MSNENGMDSAWEQNVDAHKLRFEPPDLFTIQLDGDVGPEHLTVFAGLLARATGTFYMIVETSQLVSVLSGAKKRVGELPRAAGVAYVGASRRMKLVLSLIDKVFTMLSLGKNSPITFVATDEEARQWVGDLRRRAQEKSSA